MVRSPGQPSIWDRLPYRVGRAQNYLLASRLACSLPAGRLGPFPLIPKSGGGGPSICCVEGEMRKPKKARAGNRRSGEVYRLKSSPAAFVGVVYAHDKEGAIAAAIEEHKIRPADQNRAYCSAAIRWHGLRSRLVRRMDERPALCG
jgi:hypothetical protein